MTTSIKARTFSAIPVSKREDEVKPLNIKSVGEAILRALGKKELSLSEIAKGFDTAYLAENRNLPKAEAYKLDKEAYLDGYLSYLVSKGYANKIAPKQEAETPEE